LSGRATLDQFSPLRDSEPEVQRLMRLTRVVADREMKPGTYPPLELRFKNRETIERHIPYAKGAPENPLSDDELGHKVRSQVEPVLGSERCRELIGCVSSLEQVQDFSELTRLLVRQMA
jgi:2-methylcitrate dehydratase PrpD